MPDFMQYFGQVILFNQILLTERCSGQKQLDSVFVHALVQKKVTHWNVTSKPYFCIILSQHFSPKIHIQFKIFRENI